MAKLLKRFIAHAAIVAMMALVAILVPADSNAAGPWKGQILDKETGKPLEGVVVLAVWEKFYSSVGGWAGATYYDSEEIVTGTDGRFTIQSRQTWTLNPFSIIKGPQFYIFKPGYGRWEFQGQDAWSKDALESEEQRKRAWEQFVTEGVVLDLTPLKTREERLEFYNGPLLGPPGNVPPDRMTHWKRAEDVEREYLGFQL